MAEHKILVLGVGSSNLPAPVLNRKGEILKTYRVEIVEIETGKVVSVVGRGLSESKADRRLATALTRIDTFNYFVQTKVERKLK